MPDRPTETTPPKTPPSQPDAAEELAQETPHNYDGLSPPGLPAPPGEEKKAPVQPTPGRGFPPA